MRHTRIAFLLLACPLWAYAQTRNPLPHPVSPSKGTVAVDNLLKEAARDSHPQHTGAPMGTPVAHAQAPFIFQAGLANPKTMASSASVTSPMPAKPIPVPVPTPPRPIKKTPVIPVHQVFMPSLLTAAVPSVPAAPVSAVDPFNGHSPRYESLLNQYRITQIRAKIAQERYNRMRFEKQMGHMAPGGMQPAPVENAAVRRLTTEVAQMQARIQDLSQRATQQAATRHTRAVQSLRLIAIIGGQDRHRAILQWGKKTQTVAPGAVVGRFWVRAVGRRSVTLAGPHRLHVLTMKTGIGSMDAPLRTVSATGPAGSGGITNPLQALGARLTAMSRAQSPLPPP